jgi:hypothetical protein
VVADAWRAGSGVAVAGRAALAQSKGVAAGPWRSGATRIRLRCGAAGNATVQRWPTQSAAVGTAVGRRARNIAGGAMTDDSAAAIDR